ncbi:Esterase LovG [Cytospora mali]|uniref:Esterase LovG n=1 Tax=Cytospora mali TaxID=578113 RepID=A0A194VV81_CYTMA|nr:Esterase LovG [Valsa mali]
MTQISAVGTESPFDLYLPRILCLHGGGTNSRIFRAQCRRLTAELKPEFRLVFAEGPFESSAGSDVLSVYREWGPFKRWLRWRPDQPHVQHEVVVNELDKAVEDAMRHDDALGATGEWVAILGFSQGAKVAASLLYRQQLREAQGNPSLNGHRFLFGVLLAGRAPLISLEPDSTLNDNLPDAAHLSTADDLSRVAHTGENVLRIPTLHVHGLRDKGRDLHRQLYEEFCAPDTRILVEWDGDHRVPLKAKDVALVSNHIRLLARETGVY